MNTVQKRRLAGIARWLERGAKPRKGVEGFDMNHWFGERVCVGGVAARWYSPDDMGNHDKVAAMLGLSPVTLDEIVNPAWCSNLPGGCREVGTNRLWAARMLRHLIATGVVDWQGTREAPPKGKRQ